MHPQLDQQFFSKALWLLTETPGMLLQHARRALLAAQTSAAEADMGQT